MIFGEKMKATKTLQHWLFEKNKMLQPSAEQIHVVVVVPKQKQQLRVDNFHDSGSRLENLIDDIEYYRKNNMMSASSGKLGQLELSRLHKRRRIIDFAPVASAEAFWSEEIQTQANAISDEAVFDAFITPFFSNVNCGMVFVNCELSMAVSIFTCV
ncbi:unnamed protein product [Peronospora belbahrii]|uniref:Uncharacterized protein n=1 Tax=Peronospora belbahrii TaxID=622444 RepID=A0AAU9L1F1_9STRA|nr:unnamed protein product [Peronospora belbahrii]